MMIIPEMVVVRVAVRVEVVRVVLIQVALRVVVVQVVTQHPLLLTRSTLGGT